jgi:3-hydroxyacyl-CoA dehydrogenase
MAAAAAAGALHTDSKVVVVGGGLMGSGIVQVAASSGYHVTMVEREQAALDNGKNIIGKSLTRVFKKKVEDPAEVQSKVDEIMNRITLSTDANDAAKDAGLVVEAITENMDAKKALFGALDKVAPADCMFATNTSSLSVDGIAADLERKDRFGGLHFFNPVPMMKLLEVVQGGATSDATFEKLCNFGTTLGKTVVKCKDTPGFVVNRLLVPYMMEAIRLYERGDASMDDIDVAMKLGAGYPMGPFQLIDYVGLDTTKFIIDGWHAKFPEDPLFAPSPLLDSLVKEGKTGMKAGHGFRSYEKK